METSSSIKPAFVWCETRYNDDCLCTNRQKQSILLMLSGLEVQWQTLFPLMIWLAKRAPAEQSVKNMADLRSEESLQYDILSLGWASERRDDDELSVSLTFVINTVIKQSKQALNLSQKLITFGGVLSVHVHTCTQTVLSAPNLVLLSNH